MIALRRGGPGDAPALLARFDDAVAWLVARGSPGSGGSEPPPQRPRAIARVRDWAAGDGLRLACDEHEGDHAAAGALVLGDARGTSRRPIDPSCTCRPGAILARPLG